MIPPPNALRAHRVANAPQSAVAVRCSARVGRQSALALFRDTSATNFLVCGPFDSAFSKNGESSVEFALRFSGAASRRTTREFMIPLWFVSLVLAASITCGTIFGSPVHCLTSSVVASIRFCLLASNICSMSAFLFMSSADSASDALAFSWSLPLS